MSTVDELRRRIESVSDMRSVASMMKTMAAVSIRQYESAVDAMAEYNRAVSLGLHVLLRDRPTAFETRTAKQETVGRIIFGSDQGLCGQFNEDIVRHTLAGVGQDNPKRDDRMVVVGARAANRLIDYEQTIESQFRVPTTVREITALLQELMPQIRNWQVDGVDRIVVYFNRRTSVATYESGHLQLLPVPHHYLQHCRSLTWESRSLPILGMAWNDLFAATIRQYLFSVLFRACAESRASENASRIAAMQSAERNIDRRLHELVSNFNSSRQTAITEELLDVVTGFESLTQATSQTNSERRYR